MSLCETCETTAGAYSSASSTGVVNGESLTVTLDGRPVAELRPLPGRALPAATLIARWRRLPPIDVAAFRADLDGALDSSL